MCAYIIFYVCVRNSDCQRLILGNKYVRSMEITAKVGLGDNRALRRLWLLFPF